MFLAIPRLFSISQVSSFGILTAGANIMFNICPSAFHCFQNPKECNSLLLSMQNSNNLLSKWEPSPICLRSFSHPLPLLIQSALPCSNTLISLLAYLLPYLLQVSLPITPFLQGCEPCLPGLTFRAVMFSNSIWPNTLISQKERIMPREVRCPGSHSWECGCRLTHCPMWLLQGLYNIWYELFHLTLQGKCGDVHGGWSGMQGVTQYGWLFSFKER